MPSARAHVRGSVVRAVDSGAHLARQRHEQSNRRRKRAGHRPHRHRGPRSGGRCGGLRAARIHRHPGWRAHRRRDPQRADLVRRRAYFELIAFREPDRPQEHKWWARFAKGEGTVDFALLSESVDFEGDRLKQAGIELDGPHDGGRVRPDGQRIAWRNLGLAATGAPLPFMIEDVTTRDLRVPTGAATEHELGVTGIAGLVLLVADLDRATGPYQTLLDTPGESSTPTVEGVRRARRFRFGSQWIELAEADPSASELQQHIEERGAGPYEIVLAARGRTRSGSHSI